MDKKKSVGLKKKILLKSGRIFLSFVSGMVVIGSAVVSPANAIEIADTAIASEGGKEVLNQALKVAKSKPALSIAAGITCAACVPVAGAAAIPRLCIACGILVAKVVR